MINDWNYWSCSYWVQWCWESIFGSVWSYMMPYLETLKKAKWTLLRNTLTMPCLQLVPWGWGSSDSSLSELCPYIYLISGNCTKHAANILPSKYLHRKQTLELIRYNYRCTLVWLCCHQELDLSVQGHFSFPPLHLLPPPHWALTTVSMV